MAIDPKANKIPQDASIEIKNLEARIVYKFKNRKLLDEALTHPSFNEHDGEKPDNQRLEFLGDSSLGSILAQELFRISPDDDEGKLSQKKSLLARGETLTRIGRELEIPRALLVSRTERSQNGQDRPSSIEDAVEAIIGSIYLDGGINEAKKVVLHWFADFIALIDEIHSEFNPKGRLQEFVQSELIGEKIKYHLISESGPAHNKSFVISVRIGQKTLGSGKGKSKKQAEEQAANEALKEISKFRKGNHAKSD